MQSHYIPPPHHSPYKLSARKQPKLKAIKVTGDIVGQGTCLVISKFIMLKLKPSFLFGQKMGKGVGSPPAHVLLALVNE